MIKYWKILRHQQHPTKFLLSRLLMKTRLCSLFTIHQDGFVLRFFPSAVSAQLWIDPTAKDTYSEFDTTFMASYIKNGDVIIDVGANIGRITLAASCAVGHSGKVLAFEANPRIYGYLMGNLSLNRVNNVQTHNIAVGNSNGKVLFSDIKWDDMNMVVKEMTDNCIAVPMNRLDRLIDVKQTIALLKVDVEGYEKFVLEGAGRLLDLTDCIYFESYDTNFSKYNYNSKNLFDLLNSNGFSVFSISFAKNTLSAVSGEYRSNNCENLVAIRSVDRFVQRTGFTLERLAT